MVYLDETIYSYGPEAVVRGLVTATCRINRHDREGRLGYTVRTSRKSNGSVRYRQFPDYAIHAATRGLTIALNFLFRNAVRIFEGIITRLPPVESSKTPYASRSSYTA